MATGNANPDEAVVFTPSTRDELLRYVEKYPNRRRVSPAERQELIAWLSHTHAPPSSQKESSRRNYVERTFRWDESRQMLIVPAKTDTRTDRKVVTEDKISEVVERVHVGNGHAGWDATWRDVSNSYHGILRSDVIFLLKRCMVCAKDPRKHPKNRGPFVADTFQSVTQGASSLNNENLAYGYWNSSAPQNETRGDEAPDARMGA